MQLGSHISELRKIISRTGVMEGEHSRELLLVAPKLLHTARKLLLVAWTLLLKKSSLKYIVCNMANKSLKYEFC